MCTVSVFINCVLSVACAPSIAQQSVHCLLLKCVLSAVNLNFVLSSVFVCCLLPKCVLSAVY